MVARKRGRRRELEQLGEALSGLLQSAVPEDEEIQLIFLQELWERIVGSDVSRHSEPLELKEGHLRVALREEVWLNQLRPMTSLLIGKVNGYWGGNLVERISLEIHR